MSKVDWQTCHDYSSTNEKAVCKKCGYTVTGKGAKFKDKSQDCPVKYSIQIPIMIKEHHWYGLLPDSYFFVEYQPFHVIQVDMKDYL